MKETIYDDTFESADLVNFSIGIRDLILQGMPLHKHNILLSILNPLVALLVTIQQVTQLVDDQGETECLRTGCNVQTAEGLRSSL